MKLFLLFVLALTYNTFVQAHDHVYGFKKIGRYFSPETNTVKSYYVPLYFKAQWQYTRAICKSFDFDILTLDTLDEKNDVARMIEDNHKLFSEWIHIGGMTESPKSTSEWYWVNSNEKVSYNMQWNKGDPNNNQNRELCLGLANQKGANFVDISCQGAHEEKFICQKVTSGFLTE